MQLVMGVTAANGIHVHAFTEMEETTRVNPADSFIVKDILADSNLVNGQSTSKILYPLSSWRRCACIP